MAGKGNPMQGYQEATNQLLAINEQRKSNNAQAKMEEALQTAQNNTLAQASEFVATQSPQATYQPANLNPATQNILGQYGLGQPKIQKTTSSSQQVTKQNITINNKNTTITNNNVSVPANSGGPIQGRPIQFQDPGQIKFKTWLSNSFAQQNEQAAKRQRDYEKRDSALVRNSNKLMKKLEETGKSIATSLNPKNMASSMGNQLKTLLFVFGFAKLAKEWPNLMQKIDDIRNKVVNFFGPDGGLSHIFGGRDGENAWDALKNLFIDPEDGILAYIKNWLSHRMEERSTAIKNIPKPELSIGDISGSLGNIVKYLADIFGAIINPSSVAANTISSIATKSAQDYQNDNYKALRNSIGRQEIIGGEARSISSGDAALVRGEYRGLTNTSLDRNGNLTGTAGSTLAQGLELDRALTSSRSGNLQTATIATGLNRLQNVANEKGSITLSKDFLVSAIGEEGIKELGLTQSKYSYVARPKTAEELAFDLAKVSEESDKSTKWLTGGGAVLGTVLSGNPIGGAVLGGAGYGLGELIKQAKEKNIPEYTVDLREGDNPQLAEGEKKLEWATPTAYKITKEDFQKILDKITGVENSVVDLNNYSFMSSLENSLVSKVQKGNQVHKDVNIETLYAPNRMMDQHKQEEHQRWSESRAKQGINNTANMGRDIADQIGNWAGETFGWTPGSANFSSGDLSGVIQASKRGVFYSDESDSHGEGSHGPSSPGESRKGYIKMKTYGVDKKAFQHKCTSGPETFYYDGTGGKVDIRHPKDGKSKFFVWWNTGSPKTATDSRLDKVGFKKIFIGPALKTTKDVKDAMKKKGLDLKPGDIMTMFGKSGDYISSHAQIWNGEQWVSDTYQGDLAFVYKQGRPGINGESVQIWRYDNSNNDNLSVDNAVKKGDNGISPDSDEGTDSANSTNTLTLPTYSPFQTKPSQNTSSYSPLVSYSPDSNLSDNYPSAFSSSTGDNSFTSTTSENPNYTSSLNSMGTDVKTMLGILRIMGQTDAQTLEATNNVVSAVGSLKGGGTAYTPPPSTSFTDEHYNQNPIS